MATPRSCCCPVSRRPWPRQQWNSPEALDLAARATEVRAQAQRDSSLRSYRTQAHGFVLFLAQVGDELQGRHAWSRPTSSTSKSIGAPRI